MDEIYINEASRCLNCKIPRCKEACPIHNNIPDFIAQIKNGNYESAYEIIRSVSPLGAICGRVCPQELQCEGKCVRGIKEKPITIGKLEASVCDWARKNNIKVKYDIKENNKKVAIIGAGPAGIACAVDLRKMGYDVTIYEKEKYLGGILIYGIPEYRLSNELVTSVIQDVLDIGIKIELNTKLVKESNRINKDEVSLKTLFDSGYEAIFLGIGMEKSNILSIPGNDNKKIIGANEFLRSNVDFNNKKVIVIGGGNVAMDAARVAKKENADVTVVYRKLKENMPANKDEISEAENEGVKFVFKTNIINVIEDGEKLKAKCDNDNFFEVDNIIMAIGSHSNKDYFEDELNFTDNGLLQINEMGETSIKNVFAGGDLIQKKSTVCMAIKNGKDAAISINNKLK